MGTKQAIRVDDEKLTVAEVAAELGVEEKTVRNWMSQGKLPFLKIMGATRVRKSVVDKILADADAPYMEKKGVRSVRVKREAVA